MTIEGHLVVGVMPPSFNYPYDPDAWTTLSNLDELLHDLHGRSVGVVGRLKDGISIEGADRGVADRRVSKRPYPQDNIGRA